MPAAAKEAARNDDRNIFDHFSTKVRLHGTGGTLPLLTEPCHPQRFSWAIKFQPHDIQMCSNVHPKESILI